MFIYIKDTIVNLNLIESITLSKLNIILSPPGYSSDYSGYYTFPMVSEEEAQKFMKYIADSMMENKILLRGK